MADQKPTTRTLGWRLYDAIVAEAQLRDANPWVQAADGVEFEPDYGTLMKLLGVPLLLNASSQSGVPALAFDVWTAYELRRAGLEANAVWPRPEAPRVLPTELTRFVDSLPRVMRVEARERLRRGLSGGATAASANLLGKNYVKQVDVVISAWQTGPELLISTKRMDSSFGKNAANRVEESYGDAKNLRLRHPQAALGFLYGLRSTVLDQEPAKARWLIDLLAKLGREDDAYHAVGLVISQWEGGPPAEVEAVPENDAILLDVEPADEAEGVPADEANVGDSLRQLPQVELLREDVPPELSPGRFFRIMVERVLGNSPINFHEMARERHASPRTR